MSVAVSLQFSASARAEFLPHPKHMSWPQKARYFERSVARDQSAIAWLRSKAAPRTLERTTQLRWFQAALRWHTALLADAQRRVDPQKWLDAVALIDRYFPGYAGWLKSCSQRGSEGGWGRWFWNSGGGGPYPVDDNTRQLLIAQHAVPAKPAGSSGAGGWLQFMHSTFESVIGPAIANARARGMYVPETARSWLSPLGQALAGIQMLRDGRRGEWAGWGC